MTGHTPVAWPEGYRAAASFSFDVDAESAVLFEQPSSASRPGVMSHQSYGPLVGVSRILDLLEWRGQVDLLRAGLHRAPLLERRPWHRGGRHEIAHHGYLHETLEGVDEETEARYLDRGLAALEEVVGVRPSGYRMPTGEPSWATPRCWPSGASLYDSSLMDADHPYKLSVFGVDGVASIVEVPIQWVRDDWEQYCFLPGISGDGYIASPTKGRRDVDPPGARRHAPVRRLLHADQPPVPVGPAFAGAGAGPGDRPGAGARWRVGGEPRGDRPARPWPRRNPSGVLPR